MPTECKICGRTLIRGFGKHVKSQHGITPKDYYDKFLKKDGDGICKVCGDPTEFAWREKGKKRLWYNEYCSRSCIFTDTHRKIKEDPKKNKTWTDRSRKTMLAMWADPDQREKWISQYGVKNNTDNMAKTDPEFIERVNASKHRGTLIPYKGVIMRSTWEHKFALELDELEIPWVYEFKTFDLFNGHRYTPDFYLPDFNLIVEIKPSCFIDEYVEFKIKFLKIFGYETYLLSEINWDEFIYLCRYYSSVRKNSHVTATMAKREK